MTIKTVDVIYSFQDGDVDILEVVNTEDLTNTFDRKEYYEKYYDNVGVNLGVKYYSK